MKTLVRYALTLLLVTGFASTALADKKQNKLSRKVAEAKAILIEKDPGMEKVLKDAAGYVIFPSVAKGGLGVGAATGKGQVFENKLLSKDELLGQARVTQVSIGFQAGGQAYSEYILFEDQTSLDNFRKGNFEFSAQVSAVAVTAGVSANTKYENGVMVLTIAKGGLMYEATVAGQKFNYDPY